MVSKEGVNAMKDIAVVIKTARVKAGYTQKQLGELLGHEGEYAQLLIRRWETGKVLGPVTKVRALAAALNLTLDDLIP